MLGRNGRSSPPPTRHWKLCIKDASRMPNGPLDFTLGPVAQVWATAPVKGTTRGIWPNFGRSGRHYHWHPQGDARRRPLDYWSLQSKKSATWPLTRSGGFLRCVLERARFETEFLFRRKLGRRRTPPADDNVLRSRRSTALSMRLDPEDLREVIAEYHRAVAGIITGSGGFVSRYVGRSSCT